MNLIMKYCNKCGYLLDDSEFREKHNQCKNCERETGRKYYYNNIEKQKQRIKKYQKENPEIIKKYRQKNKEKIREYRKKYRKSEKYKKYLKEYNKKYYNKNREKLIKRFKEKYYNKEKNRKYAKKWREQNLERYREINREHHAKRNRNLKWIKLWSNPFPDNIEVDYHYINNILVVPIPKGLHESTFGKNHHNKCNEIIENIYYNNVTKLFDDINENNTNI